MTKAELRKICLNQQKRLSHAERVERSGQISEAFFRRFDLGAIKFLHSFLPIEKFNEIDTWLIVTRIWRDFPQIETLAPRVDWAMGEMESVKFSAQTALVQNRWEIFEPQNAETLSAEKIDLVIVPLLCFDKRGYRVGYGKGFYDRFLKNCRADCLKIGLSYFAPVEKISDAQSFDVKLDYCVTPEKIWNFNTIEN